MANKYECQDEVRDLFEKLSSWRDESEKQITGMINSHSSSISKGISDLTKEVCDLQAELIAIRKERNVLLDTIENLNDEIKHLNKKSCRTPPSTKSEDNSAHSHNISLDETSPDLEIPDTTEYITEELNVQCETIKEEHLYEGNISYQDANVDFDCSECNLPFSCEENLKLHLENLHSKLDLTEVCQGLNDAMKDQSEESIFENDSKYQRESQLKIAENEFKCRKCPYTAPNISRLKQHFKGVHDRIKDHVCGICGYATPHKVNLTKHNIMQHGIGEKKYKCKQCSVRVPFRSDLVRHIKNVHDKIKDNVCADCGYATSEKGALKRHRNMVHKMGEKKFKCDKCPFKSYNNYELTRHTSRVHDKVRNHKCKECGKAYGCLRDLRNHMDTVHSTGKDNE